MNWTSLIAEYLVIGFQGLVWLALLVLAAVDSSVARPLHALSDIPVHVGALVVLVGLVAAYSLGTLLDHLWYLATMPYLKWQTRRNWDRFFRASPAGIGKQFYAAEDHLLGKEGQRERVLRRRGRIRVLRATFFHVPLTWIAVSLHYNSLWLHLLATALLVVVALVLRAVFMQYLRTVARAARWLTERSPDEVAV